MTQLLIGDCHFGIRSNSIMWLDKQITFFKEQIYDIIQNENIDRVVFLGDLTDVRYSIEQQVGIELKILIRDMLETFKDKEFVMVAGNHDYFSHLEEFAMYNSYELIFGDEFIRCHPNLKIVSNEPYFSDDGSLFLPWYWTENTDHFDEMLYMYDMKHTVNAIFCHADLSCWPGARIASLYGKPVYSGHIHFIYDDKIGNLHNIGAAFSFTFNDIDQDRYVYIIDDTFEITKKIKNTSSYKFISLVNEQIFSADDEMFRDAYVRLCISNNLKDKARYVDQIKYLRITYPNTVFSIYILDDENDNLNSLPSVGLSTNISKYIDDNMPDYLIPKYNKVKTILNEPQ